MGTPPPHPVGSRKHQRKLLNFSFNETLQAPIGALGFLSDFLPIPPSRPRRSFVHIALIDSSLWGNIATHVPSTLDLLPVKEKWPLQAAPLILHKRGTQAERVQILQNVQGGHPRRRRTHLSYGFLHRSSLCLRHPTPSWSFFVRRGYPKG